MRTSLPSSVSIHHVAETFRTQQRQYSFQANLISNSTAKVGQGDFWASPTATDTQRFARLTHSTIIEVAAMAGMVANSLEQLAVFLDRVQGRRTILVNKVLAAQKNVNPFDLHAAGDSQELRLLDSQIEQAFADAALTIQRYAEQSKDWRGNIGHNPAAYFGMAIEEIGKPVGSVIKGAVAAGSDVVEGLTTLFLHPDQIAEGVVAFVRDPPGTTSKIVQQQIDEFKKDPAEFVAHAGVGILITVLTAGAGAALKGAAVGKSAAGLAVMEKAAAAAGVAERMAAASGASITALRRAERLLQKTEPDFLRKFREGREFDRENWHRYGTYNEITLTDPRYPVEANRRVRLDSYVPSSEIVSRKYSQLGQIDKLTVNSYINELVAKYNPNAIVKETEKARRDYPELIGRPIRGDFILEVPVQATAISSDVLEYALKQGVTIRDISGKAY